MLHLPTTGSLTITHFTLQSLTLSLHFFFLLTRHFTSDGQVLVGGTVTPRMLSSVTFTTAHSSIPSHTSFILVSLSTSHSISTPTVVYRQTLLRTSLTHSYTLRDFWTLPTLVPIRSHSQLISAFLSHTDLFYDDQRFSLLIAAAIVCDRSRSTNSCHTSNRRRVST